MKKINCSRLAVLAAQILAVVMPIVVITSTLPAGITGGVLSDEEAEALMATVQSMALTWFAVGAAGLLVLFLSFSYLFKRICEKADSEPGLLVWIPILQFFR